jgi:hypothetical protein
MASFDLSKYQTVQQRIDLFWERYPQGRFNVDIISLTDAQVVMKAEVWTDWAEDAPRAVDYAEERPTTSGVNKTSHIENCATSALGRAISQLGGNLSPTGVKPSREEMEKVARRTEQDFWTAANEAFNTKNLESLRNIYVDAQKAGVSQALLKEISDWANGLKSAPNTKG